MPDPKQILATMAEQIRALQDDTIVLVGIYSGGAMLATRLQALLGTHIPVGFLDMSFYRDDFADRGLNRNLKPSKLPFDVQDRHIVLVDDILYTGRTIRGAMNALFDYGRPAKITLAVLIDRGGRQMPIEAQIVGTRMTLPDNQYIALVCDDQNQLQLICDYHEPS